MYFLAHCWEFFFPFYLAVRLVWPKIRIDFFLPFTWASEKNGPWLAVHYLFSLIILGSSAMSAHSCGQILCFLLLGPPICWKNWKSLFCFHALGPSILSLQHSQNHMVMPWFYLLSWANHCSMGYKQIFLM